MGAWGAGSFENDTALDFLQTIAEARDGLGTESQPGKVGLVIGPLAVAVAASTDIDDMRDGDDDDEGGYLDADLACDAVVAAEILAAVHGKPHPYLATANAHDAKSPAAAVAAWATGPARRHADLMSGDARELARNAVVKIRDGGELRELWDDAHDSDADSGWLAAMNDLIERLR